MRVVRREADRRIHFLIAEKSMKRKFIGNMARLAGSLPVGRALDSTKSVKGRIYLPDPINDPMLIRGVGTDFEAKDVQEGGLIVLPSVDNLAASAEIQEIRGKEEIRLKRPFRGATAVRQLTGRDDVGEDGRFEDGKSAKSGPKPGFEGVNFKVAPKVNQTEVYDAVFETLTHGGCIGIFPEGGSHDRPELLPLKGAHNRPRDLKNKLLTLNSWCSDHGSWSTCQCTGLRVENYPRGDELFPRPQIPITGCHRIWNPC